jgi:L-amino acid N-acyltransferase YncA
MESLPEIDAALKVLGCTIELFQPEDEQSLYQIYREVVETGGQFPYSCSSIEEFHRQFFAPGMHVYICRSSTGELVGGFYIRANYSGKSDHIANAAYMVSSANRGRGLGTLLVKASLHLAKQLSFRAMQFNLVLSQNSVAVNLYKKLGFQIVGTVPEAVRNSDGSYQDAHIMHRTL